MSHLLDLAIVFLYGYFSGMFVIGFTRIAYTGLNKPKTIIVIDTESTNLDTGKPEPATIQVIEPVKKSKPIKKTSTANKELSNEKILVIPVDNSIDPEVELEQLKEEAKTLKIKGYQFYKNIDKLRAKIKEVKEQQ